MQQPHPNATSTAITIPIQPGVVPHVVAAPSTAVVVGPTVYTNFSHKQALGVGITLIVAGVLDIVFNCIDIVDKRPYYPFLGFIGQGFWVGAMCIVPGALGVRAAILKTKCLIVAFNVMCVIAASFALCQFIISLIGAIVGSSYCYEPLFNLSFSMCQTDIAMEALLTVLAVVEATAAIWGSVICCRTVCCCSCCVADPDPGDAVTQPTGMSVNNENQPLLQAQQPVVVQSNQNVACQPGYPTPHAATAVAAAPWKQPFEGQFIPADV